MEKRTKGGARKATIKNKRVVSALNYYSETHLKLETKQRKREEVRRNLRKRVKRGRATKTEGKERVKAGLGFRKKKKRRS